MDFCDKKRFVFAADALWHQQGKKTVFSQKDTA